MTQTVPMVRTQVMNIDRGMAELLLSYEKEPERGVSGTNRRHSPEVVALYARHMLKGKWHLTHQGIGFVGFFADKSAILADGGHRLRAVILASETEPGITVPFMVTEGLTEEDMQALDIGKKRTPGDFLTMDGEVDTNLLAAVIKLSMMVEDPAVDLTTYDGRRRTLYMPEEIKAYLEQNPEIRAALPEGKRLHTLMSATAAASAWFLLIKSGRKDTKLIEFMDGLRYGNDLPKFNPILTLRDLLNNAQVRRRGYNNVEQLALLFKAYKLWEAGKESKVLFWRGDEEFPTL